MIIWLHNVKQSQTPCHFYFLRTELNCLKYSASCFSYCLFSQAQLVSFLILMKYFFKIVPGIKLQGNTL